MGARSRAAAPPHGEEQAAVARASISDATWTSPSGGVLGMSCWEGNLGKTQDTLGTSWDPPRSVGGSVWGEESLGDPVRTAAQYRVSKKMDGWKLSDRHIAENTHHISIGPVCIHCFHQEINLLCVLWNNQQNLQLTHRLVGWLNVKSNSKGVAVLDTKKYKMFFF